MKKAKNFYMIFAVTIVLTMFSSLSWGAATPVTSQDIKMSGVVKKVSIQDGFSQDGFYGIMGDDGKRYQPINLPRNFKKDGLPIKFTAQIREDKVSSLMWGTIIELKDSNRLTTTIDIEERTAIYVLLKRIDSFNQHDLGKLQQIDTVSRNLSQQQFTSWLANYSNFTLRYVEIQTADATTITGTCWYTRELANTMTLHGNVELALMNFTLSKTTDGWKLTDSGYNSVPTTQDTLTAIQEKAKLKYKTDNLALILQI